MKSKYNSNGNFDGNYSDDFLDKNKDKTIKGELVSEWSLTDTLYQGQFYTPFFNGVDWVEVATNEEINNINYEKYKKKIEHLFKHLSVRAEASSMNKSNLDPDFLKYQRAEYQDKYNVANGDITSGIVYDKTLSLIQAEMTDEFNESVLDAILPTLGVVGFTGTHLEKMFKLITTKFEYGRKAFDTFNLFVRHFRTKSFLWLRTNDWLRLEQGIDFAENIPDSLTIAEAEQLYNQFNTI